MSFHCCFVWFINYMYYSYYTVDSAFERCLPACWSAPHRRPTHGVRHTARLGMCSSWPAAWNSDFLGDREKKIRDVFKQTLFSSWERRLEKECGPAREKMFTDDNPTTTIITLVMWRGGTNAWHSVAPWRVSQNSFQRSLSLSIRKVMSVRLLSQTHVSITQVTAAACEQHGRGTRRGTLIRELRLER